MEPIKEQQANSNKVRQNWCEMKNIVWDMRMETNKTTSEEGLSMS
jgi:hypothetical protein